MAVHVLRHGADTPTFFAANQSLLGLQRLPQEWALAATMLASADHLGPFSDLLFFGLRSRTSPATTSGRSGGFCKDLFFPYFESWSNVRLDAKMNLRDEINPPVMRTVPCCLSNDQSMATGFSSEIGFFFRNWRAQDKAAGHGAIGSIA
jgi:hypothetical protein